MFQLSIIDAAGDVRAVSGKADEVILVYAPAYIAGDKIRLAVGAPGFVVAQLDDAMEPALLYVTGTFDLAVPFGEARIPYSPRAFSGEMHASRCARRGRRRWRRGAIWR